ncbi:MAG TPA: hypothetical protein VN952_10370, partial [Chthoniobacterales bacterium]|nr:hypothetical protein [Chthoniobacterales bacterium]
ANQTAGNFLGQIKRRSRERRQRRSRRYRRELFGMGLFHRLNSDQTKAPISSLITIYYSLISNR